MFRGRVPSDELFATRVFWRFGIVAATVVPREMYLHAIDWGQVSGCYQFADSPVTTAKVFRAESGCESEV